MASELLPFEVCSFHNPVFLRFGRDTMTLKQYEWNIWRMEYYSFQFDFQDILM